MANPWDPIPEGEEKSSSSDAPMKSRAEWSDIYKNILPSGYELAKSVVQPIIDPINTYKGLKSLVTDPKAREAVGEFYKNRYGGWENVRNTLITDPLGLASDVASVLTLGSGAAAGASKALGVAGRATAASKAATVAKGLGKAGELVDPLFSTAKGTGKIIKPIIGFTTGAGSQAIGEAYKAGQTGEKAFRQEQKIRSANLKRNIVDDFDASLDAAQRAASAEYKANFPQSTFDVPTTSVLASFNTIKNSFAPKQGSRNPQWKITKSEQKKLANIERIIKDATTSNGQPGLRDIDELDALKQRLSSEFNALPEEGSAAPKAAITAVNQEIRNLLNNTHSEYASVMERYGEAKELIQDAKKTFGKESTAIDTKLARLRKVLYESPKSERNLEIINRLEQVSGKPIKARLAGESLSNWLPQSYIQKFSRTVGPVVGVGVGAVGAGSLMAANLLNPATLGAAALTSPLFSPKLMGLSSYGLGKASKYVPSTAKIQALAETGQITPEAQSYGPNPWDPIAEEEPERKAIGGLASLKKRYA